MKLLTPINKFLRKTREKLSKYPIIYAILGAIGIILFWRGVWHTADFLPLVFIDDGTGMPLNYAYLFDSLLSAVIGFTLLLATGLFVGDFIGSQMVSTAIKEEKKIEKITEETESDEEKEKKRMTEFEEKFERVTNHLDEHLESIEKKLKDK